MEKIILVALLTLTTVNRVMIAVENYQRYKRRKEKQKGEDTTPVEDKVESELADNLTHIIDNLKKKPD